MLVKEDEINEIDAKRFIGYLFKHVNEIKSVAAFVDRCLKSISLKFLTTLQPYNLPVLW